MSGLSGYNIYHKDNNDNFSLLQQVDITTLTHIDRAIQNGHCDEYYVVVRSPTGEGSASNVAKVAINVDPVIIIASENITHTLTKNVDLTLIALGTLY